MDKSGGDNLAVLEPLIALPAKWDDELIQNDYYTIECVTKRAFWNLNRCRVETDSGNVEVLSFGPLCVDSQWQKGCFLINGGKFEFKEVYCGIKSNNDISLI